MRGFIISGALLIVFGVAVLVNQGMNFSTPKKSVQLGSLKITETERHHVPTALGILALVGGLALVVVGTKKP